MAEYSSCVIEGAKASRLENGLIRLSVIDATGQVAELRSLRTGHEHLWVSGSGIRGAGGQWGIEIPFVALPSAPAVMTPTTAAKGGAGFLLEARESGLVQTVAFELSDGSACVRVRVAFANEGSGTRSPDPRFRYSVNAASDAEAVDLQSRGPRLISLTGPHGGQRLFVGREAQWPGEGFWEGHEAGEERFEPFVFREKAWLRPRWLAVVDRTEREGVAARFLRAPAVLRSWMQGHHFSPAIDLEHDLDLGTLAPGEERSFEMEWIGFEGLSRVDEVGKGYVVGIELKKWLKVEEEQ